MRARNDWSAEAVAYLVTLRKDAGLSRSQVAKRMGVSLTTVSDIEQGGSLRMSTLRNFAHALGARVVLDVVVDKERDRA